MKKILLSLLCLAAYAADDGMYPAGGYASKKIQDMFCDARFSSQNVLVSSVQAYVGSGDLTVAFGSGQQLEESIQKNVIIDAGTVTYQYDPSATAFTLRKYVGQMMIGCVILIEGPAGMRMSGHVRGEKGAVVYAPQKMDVSGVMTCPVDLRSVPSTVDRSALIHYLGLDKDQRELGMMIRQRDLDMLVLQIKGIKEGVVHHQKFFEYFHPGLSFVSDKPVAFDCGKGIESYTGVIIAAPDTSRIDSVLKEYPLRKPIRLLTSHLSMGVYSFSPFNLFDVYEVKTEGALMVIGAFRDRAAQLILKGNGMHLLSFGFYSDYDASLSYGQFLYRGMLETIGEIPCLKVVEISLYIKLLDKLKSLGIIDQENYDKLLKRRKTLDEENGEMKLALEDAFASSLLGWRRS